MRNPNAVVSDPNSFFTDPGDPIHEIREAFFNGEETIVKPVGKENIQEKIDEYGPYTDLNYMLSHLAAGDTSVLNHSDPLYGDFSIVPQNPIDFVNEMSNSKSLFESLPEDVRASYGGDWLKWLASKLNGVFSPVSPDPDSSGNAPDPDIIDSPMEVIPNES